MCVSKAHSANVFIITAILQCVNPDLELIKNGCLLSIYQLIRDLIISKIAVFVKRKKCYKRRGILMDVFKQKHWRVWLGSPEFLYSAQMNRRRTPSLGRNPKCSLLAAVVWLLWWLKVQMLWGRDEDAATLCKTACLDLAGISALSASCRQIGSPPRLFLDVGVRHFSNIRWWTLLLFSVSPWTPAPQVLNEFLLLSEKRDHHVLGAGSFTSPSLGDRNRGSWRVRPACGGWC